VLPSDGRSDNRILLLDIDGVITEFGDKSWFQLKEPTTFQVRQKLERALNDPNIKAVILRVNSPGGGANASDIVYRELMDFKEQLDVPVVAMMQGIAASGGYYVSCAADRIIANPNTVTGSIGVIAFNFGFDGLFEKIGMESRVTKSGELKDMGNPFDEWTDPEKAAMQKIVDSMYARFVDVVAERRQLDKDQIKTFADGRVMTAWEAKELNLIDEVGYIDDAVYEAMKLAKIRDAEVIMYIRREKSERNLYTQSEADMHSLPSGLSLNNLSTETLLELGRPKLLYMWIGE
jgi:protease-4